MYHIRRITFEGPSTEMAKEPGPASRVHTLNSAGSPCIPLSRPGPPACTRWEPESCRGPTVNWNGDPGISSSRYLKQINITLFNQKNEFKNHSCLSVEMIFFF